MKNKATIKVHMYTNPIKQIFIRYKVKGQKPITHFLSATDYKSDTELAEALIALTSSYEQMYTDVHSLCYHIPEGSHGLFMKSKLKDLRQRYKMENSLLEQIKEATAKVINLLNMKLNIQYKPETNVLAIYHNSYSACLYTIDITQENINIINTSIQRLENDSVK